MILACHNIEKSFGDRVIVHEGSFHIEEREKAALVGINGAGKSTILKMIMDEEPLDGGDIILAKGKTIGYLAQHQDLSAGRSIYEELLSVKQYLLDMEEKIRRGEILPVTEWMEKNIWQYGCCMTAGEMIRKLTGHGLDAGPFLRYLEQKYLEQKYQAD